MKTRSRIPSDLAWIIFLCLFLGGVTLAGGFRAQEPFRRAYALVLGGSLVLVATALYRMRGWARWAAAGALLIETVGDAAALATRGFTVLRAITIATQVWFTVYLLSPSTARMFAASGGGRIDTASGILFLLALGLVSSGVFLSRALRFPEWVWLGIVAAAVVAYLAVEERMRRWLEARFSPRPGDVEGGAWPTFRAARQARAAGDLERAEMLLTGVPPSRSADLLRGLLAMDRARAAGSLRRVVYDASFVASEVERVHILAETGTTDLGALIEERARLVDALFEDARSEAPAFAEELEGLLERLTGRSYSSNAEHRLAEWWAAARPRCTGDRALMWLVARLWEAQCHRAAEAVVSRMDDALLGEAAALARILEEAPKQAPTEEWLSANARTLALHPRIGDLFGLLQMDLPFVSNEGPERGADRVRVRLLLVAWLRQFWEEYEETSAVEPPWMLAHLTGFKARRFRRRAAFDAWWSVERPTQERHDAAFIRGLEAASDEKWAEAEKAFGEAGAAWPERTSAPYNRALALLRLQRYGEAEEIFARQAAASPEEPLYWMRVGDCRRLSGRVRESLQAYEKAARLGGLEEQLAIRLGITLAQDDQEELAAQAFEKVLGREPDADTLEQFSIFLESQGVHRMAQRYRDEAFYRSLGSKKDDEDDEDDAEPTGV